MTGGVPAVPAQPPEPGRMARPQTGSKSATLLTSAKSLSQLLDAPPPDLLDLLYRAHTSLSAYPRWVGSAAAGLAAAALACGACFLFYLLLRLDAAGMNPTMSEFVFHFMNKQINLRTGGCYCERSLYKALKLCVAGVLLMNVISYYLEDTAHTLEEMDILESADLQAALSGESEEPAPPLSAHEAGEVRLAYELKRLYEIEHLGAPEPPDEIEVEVSETDSDPEPLSEEEKRRLVEREELEAVKKLKDPRKLREFIRKQEMRKSREELRAQAFRMHERDKVLKKIQEEYPPEGSSGSERSLRVPKPPPAAAPAPLRPPSAPERKIKWGTNLPAADLKARRQRRNKRAKDSEEEDENATAAEPKTDQSSSGCSEVDSTNFMYPQWMYEYL